MWNPPAPGINLVSHALQGGFLTTVPPVKPQETILRIYFLFPWSHNFLLVIIKCPSYNIFMCMSYSQSRFYFKIKRHLLLGRKVMTNLDSFFKNRDITLPTKVCLVKFMVFPVVMYGCERWTIKKAERRRIDTFELWCWRRLLRVPWTARRSNQSIIKEISPEYSLEGFDVEAETPVLWPPDAKSWLIWKDSDAGKDWRWEEKGTTEDEMVGWHHWLNGHEFE